MVKRSVKKRTAAPVEHEPEIPVESESRTVYLVGNIDEDLIQQAVEKLVTLSEKRPNIPIHLIISTYGGVVDDTFMLYDLIKHMPTPVYTVGLGKVMSAGCLLLAAGTKGHRKLGRNARVMYHCGWEVSAGSVWEMRANLKAFEDQERQYDTRFAEETGMTLKQVEDLYNRYGPTADRYLSAEEALKLNIVDALI